MSIADKYPIINAHINGALKDLWENFRDYRINTDPKLSPARAGELAAAHLIREYATELVNLEQAARRQNFTAQPDEALCAFYDDHVEARNACTPAALVTEWSGSRTLIDDVHFA